MTTATSFHLIAADWYSSFVEAGGSPGRGVEWIIAEAEAKAEQYRNLGTAYDDFQPGNGTSYKLILHDMIAPGLEQFGVTPDELAGRPLGAGKVTDAELREIAGRRSMAARVGGELLVSLPENAGGRSAVLSVHEGALYTPDYIEGHLGVRFADAMPLAVYLSAFVQKVSELRART